MADLSPQILRELLTYNPDTGELFWKPRDRKWFKSERSWNAWNERFANKIAMQSKNPDWYCEGSIFGIRVRAHRVAWAVYHGQWPDGQIDHIDGNRLNNRIENLRDVSASQNQRNSKKRHDNTSGVVGVTFMQKPQRWRAQIKVKGEFKYLGLFKGKDDAIAARKAAEIEYGFHANHGMR